MGTTEQMAIERPKTDEELAIDTLKRKLLRDDKALLIAVKALTEIQQYRAIGTVEECEKYKRGCIIANVTFDKEKLQEIVNEKIKEVELDANAIRNKGIEEFAEAICCKVSDDSLKVMLPDGFRADMVTIDFVNELVIQIAESMKGGK